ncbi:hypothetical protein DFP73DRAFT_633327 [Morchella snyderi]|nr:hypothetical protein DFP73DRAFT_633327 [Morchella snyderi]
MGKLNYTNRRISGEKLGNAVKRDILKCITQSTKPGRALKDPHLELNLQGKHLCDGGLKLACEGLAVTLEAGCSKLDELNLSENKITLIGLSHLTRVVKLAAKDLKDLDLSRNIIQILTEEDEEIWENFLMGFRDVCTLRRLDLSENPLGDKGMEIFLSVYVRESPILLPRAVKPVLAESSDEEYYPDFEADSDTDTIFSSEPQPLHSYLSHENFSESPPSPHSTSLLKLNKPYIAENPSLDRSPTLSLSMSLVSSRADIRGLRSIPYLIFSNSIISDKGALFLSYVIPIHYTPERLLLYFPPTRPGSQTEIFDRYDRIPGCSGIIYRENELTAMGLKVLELAESTRENRTQTPTSPRSPRSRQVSETSNGLLTPLKHRKDSFSSQSPHSVFQGVSSTELERARSKIQGAILKDSGVGSITVWRIAIKMLSISRTIFFDKEDPGTDYLTLTTRTSQRHSPIRQTFNTFNPRFSGLHVGSLNFPHTAQFQQHHPNILDGQGAWNGPNVSQLGSPTISQRDMPDFPSPVQYSCSSTTETSELEELQEKTPKKLPGNLPAELWIRIIALATDPKGVLSGKQRKNIVTWAKTSESLERERDLAGKLRSVQIWRVLEALECLSYEFKTGREI